jgi:hypothetical protein
MTSMLGIITNTKQKLNVQQKPFSHFFGITESKH